MRMLKSIGGDKNCRLSSLNSGESDIRYIGTYLQECKQFKDNISNSRGLNL